ncbi:methylglyoxal reductase (NADPH-dependent) gre2 [Thoreauomyces humboldtii]|nr:methylglyoxal reductase (NADPH-dependent) gre2 [Thoreauomyces humboldtii]
MSDVANTIVVVTGVTGFVGSHVADQFLEKGYRVRGTLRNLEKAKGLKERWAKHGDRIEFFIVKDLIHEGAFEEVVAGAHLIAHVASPVGGKADEDAYRDYIDPARKGTLSVLEAAHKSPSVRRVVITSSVAAMVRPRDAPGAIHSPHTYTEADWNDWALALVEKHGNDAPGNPIYPASKAEAERAAWKFVEEHKPSFVVTTICPSFVFGPVITRPTNPRDGGPTIEMVYKFINGGVETISPSQPHSAHVDVRDVSEAHVQALLNEKASGRYLVAGQPFSWQEIADIARETFPDRKIVVGNPGDRSPQPKDVVYGKKAADEFGIKYIGLKQSLQDTWTSMLETVVD